MGALYQTPSLVHDLKVTLLTSTTLYPPEPTERRSMFLSNIDQVLNFTVETVHFFEANPDHPVDSVVEKLRVSLEKLLVPYDFLAGRLRFNSSEGRLEIDCNAAGVSFTVAESELRLDEVGELEYPNLAFRQLALAKSCEGLGLEDQPLASFQVTSFKCGGFAFGVSNNHTTFDGASYLMFLKNLASLTFNKPLEIPPFNNRHLLAARSPPNVAFSHPELVKFDSNLHGDMLNATWDSLEFKLFRLTADDIFSLKEKAKMDSDGSSSPPVITSFNVVTAHLWRCKALAAVGYDEAKTSTILYAVDIRARLCPPLPQAYTGNAVLSAYGTTTCQKLEQSPFYQLVEMVSEGAKRMNDEYARSAIDWGSLYKGFPHGDAFVSSWWKLGFAEVEYPWGKARYSCPVIHPRRDIILLFPSIEGRDKGVNALVALPSGDVEKFQSLFYKFLK